MVDIDTFVGALKVSRPLDIAFFGFKQRDSLYKL